MVRMRHLLLALVLAGSTGSLTAPLQAEGRVYDISCEICRRSDSSGKPCKGRVSRESTSSNGITYSCSAGHTFIVPPKVRVN
jgi:hypothetical protein